MQRGVADGRTQASSLLWMSAALPRHPLLNRIRAWLTSDNKLQAKPFNNPLVLTHDGKQIKSDAKKPDLSIGLMLHAALSTVNLQSTSCRDE
jgi:hypothetical protein